MVPFLKWAGGKRWLFSHSFLNSLPPFERYVEPFLGGGAGFFALTPERSILSDLNADLIELYKVVRDFPGELKMRLSDHQILHSKSYYYSIRDTQFSCAIDRAARTLYLNRTCWNGLYRLNKSGQFNVPIGTKTSVLLPTDNFQQASILLKKAQILSCDFQDTIELTKKGDLIFVDPPYTVKHDMNGFVKYNERIFGWADQIRLRNSLVAASARGAIVVVTNANHASVKELYEGFGKHFEITRKSIISGKSTGRSGVSELMVRT